MNLLAINGSRRKSGNTQCLIDAILQPARQAGATVESLHLGDYDIEACTGCEGCSKSWTCVIDDDFATLVAKMDGADGIVLGSPTYWYSVTSDMKRFIDRCYSLIQYPHSRREWIGKYMETGKFCVTTAVAEQPDEAMMGNTLTLLSDFAGDIGLDVVDTVKALGFFEAGCVAGASSVMEQAESVGRALVSRLRD